MATFNHLHIEITHMSSIQGPSVTRTNTNSPSLFLSKNHNKLALLAQSVARVTLNHKVRGSSPLQGYLFFTAVRSYSYPDNRERMTFDYLYIRANRH